MVKYIKGAVVILCFIAFGICAVFLRYFVLIFPEYFIKDETERLKTCAKILRKSWKFFVWFLTILKIVKIEGEIEKLKNIQNSIIVSTHPSYIDVLILISLIPNSTCFVAKKLAKNPFFKGMVDLLFIIEEENIEKVEKSVLNMANKGFNIIIFPTSGRHKRKERPKVRKGASFFAQKTKQNIALVKIETNFDFLQKNSPIYKAGKKPTTYTLSYLGEINTKEFLLKFQDEVTFRYEITNLISKSLFE